MRIAVVFDTPNEGWTDEDFRAEMVAGEEEAEYEVAEALLACGHEVLLLGVYDDLEQMLEELDDFGPELVFNCSETFLGEPAHDYIIPAVIESAGYPYTGAGPACMLATRDKALSKKVLAFHGVLVPEFHVFPPDRPVRVPRGLSYPRIVKPAAADASEGISSRSVVHTAAALRKRVAWVHDWFEQPAIVEQFVEGRELYVGVVGNPGRLELLRLTEIVFDPARSRPNERIASRLAKWDVPYRDRHGVRNVFARPVSKAAMEEMETLARIAYDSLELRDYARIDVRLGRGGELWVLEVNCNPYISFGHDMSNAAEKSGMDYYELIDRIVHEAQLRHAD
jgi:D-alanine-D-alanine ligase